MRHGISLRKFGRTPAHRRAMFRNLATSLFEHERIETTVHKAKDLRRVAEKLITLAGNDTLAGRRKAYSYLQSKQIVHKLFAEIGPRFKERPGGYTRVLKTRVRAGDAAEMALIELVQENYAAGGKAKAKKKQRKKKAAPAQTEKQTEEKVAAKAEEAAAEPTEAQSAAEPEAVEASSDEQTEKEEA